MAICQHDSLAACRRGTTATKPHNMSHVSVSVGLRDSICSTYTQHTNLTLNQLSRDLSPELSPGTLLRSLPPNPLSGTFLRNLL